MVAAVNGPAVGLGASVAVSCDIVLIAESTYIADTHVNIGLTAGDGGAATWPLLIGMLRAKEYLLTGERIPAKLAVEIGLANRLVADDQLMEEATALAHKLAALPPQSVQETETRAQPSPATGGHHRAPVRAVRRGGVVCDARDQGDDREVLQVAEVERSAGPDGAPNEFKLTGEVRSPAKTMGPRALRTSGLIKECAREVFLAKGYFGTSVEEIAEAAGVFARLLLHLLPVEA